MPVTPFHGGVGLIAKGIAGRRISFVGFSATQIAMDLESGYFLFRDEWPFHCFFHTVIGATVACGLAVWLCRQVARRWSLGPASRRTLARFVQLDLVVLLSLPGAVATAVLGVVGHVVPDGIMHSDVRPFAPFTDANPFHAALSLSVLHSSLFGIGALGAALIAWRGRRQS